MNSFVFGQVALLVPAGGGVHGVEPDNPGGVRGSWDWGNRANSWVISNRAIPGRNCLTTMVGFTAFMTALNAEGGAEVTVY